MARRCNLKCVHRYAQTVDPDGKGEISTEQGKAVISDPVAYGAPVILFSGDEPLIHRSLPELVNHVIEKGMHAITPTGGILVTKERARELKAINLSCVGVPLDGAKEIHDKFRGVPNSFRKVLEGLENCKAEGLKAGLRFTIGRRSTVEIPEVFKLLRELEVPRIRFYHLIYSGRGSEMIKEDLNHAETRSVVNLIVDETCTLFDAGMPKEALTMDNHADGLYVWMHMLKEGPKRAREMFQLLQYDEGNSSDHNIDYISWDDKAYVDQFWRNHTFGNVLERPFSEIWDDPNIELPHKMKSKKTCVKGRCAPYRFLNICGGNFRSHAETYYGDEWA